MAEKKKPGRPKKDKNIVAPKIPKENVQEEEDVHPLDDIENVKLANIDQPTLNDKLLIERMSAHMLSADEICAILDISRSRFDGNLALQAAYQRGQEMGKATLRRLQWKSAMKGNAIMQIWLGKQYLGQADKLETTKDDGNHDADRQSFEDKLKSIIDITPEGSAYAEPDGQGEGDRQLLLAVVGERQPVSPNQARVVEPRNNTEAD